MNDEQHWTHGPLGRRDLRGSRPGIRRMGAGGQPPIRIGSTLALTGPLAATSLIHKVVGEIYVEQLNKRGGLLGRPVQWIVKDDQSKLDLARTLYEQLITADKVDLLMGPYARARSCRRWASPSATTRC